MSKWIKFQLVSGGDYVKPHGSVTAGEFSRTTIAIGEEDHLFFLANFPFYVGGSCSLEYVTWWHHPSQWCDCLESKSLVFSFFSNNNVM